MRGQLCTASTNNDPLNFTYHTYIHTYNIHTTYIHTFRHVNSDPYYRTGAVKNSATEHIAHRESRVLLFYILKPSLIEKIQPITAKTLPPKTQPKSLPNTTQCKHCTLVPKLYYSRLNPNVYPTQPSVNTLPPKTQPKCVPNTTQCKH